MTIKSPLWITLCMLVRGCLFINLQSYQISANIKKNKMERFDTNEFVFNLFELKDFLKHLVNG